MQAIVVCALFLLGCSAAVPEDPDPADDAPEAVSALLLEAEQACDAERSGSVHLDAAGRSVSAFDQVEDLSAVVVPVQLIGGAHEQWWRRYLAVRRATQQRVVQENATATLQFDHIDPAVWREVLARFEERLDATGDVDGRELAAMRAGASAADERVVSGGLLLLGEVERRLAARLGIVGCNQIVLAGDLDEHPLDDSTRAYLAEVAELLVGGE